MNILLAETTKIIGKNAGNKARNDVKSILVSMGIKHVNLYNCGDKHYKIFISTLKAMIKTVISLNKGDVLIIEHPYTPIIFSDILSRFAYGLKIMFEIKTVVIIHDINSIRYEKISESNEFKVLDRYSYIVVHNEEMKSLFDKKKSKAEIIKLNLFDYLIQNDYQIKKDFNLETVIIAGNLNKEKSRYIYEFSNEFKINFNLYGMGVDIDNLPRCMIYKGSFSPEELPSVLEGGYGLVWDGDSIEDCVGLSGKYLKYNNPHKASLYIVAGKPLIVWKKSAIAAYVCEKEIGITIDNLNDLPHVLNCISKKEYMKLVRNVLKEREELINGEHLKRAYKKINS